jgi:hypothetical protein
MQTELHFLRYEFKYVLPKDRRMELEGELGYFMALDPFVNTLKGNRYFVRSLYFDDNAHTNYYEKIDGVMERRKYRIRTYTDDESEDCSVFLEVKGRHNALAFKHRVQLPREIIPGIADGREALLEKLAGCVGSDDVFQRFYFDSYRMGLWPKVLVDYYRRPYISRYSPDFRVTFDDSLQSTRTDRLFGRTTDRRRDFLPGYTVVEIKFRRRIPSWFHRLIQHFELYRYSVSKCCHGMESLGIVENLE